MNLFQYNIYQLVALLSGFFSSFDFAATLPLLRPGVTDASARFRIESLITDLNTSSCQGKMAWPRDKLELQKLK